MCALWWEPHGIGPVPKEEMRPAGASVLTARNSAKMNNASYRHKPAVMRRTQEIAHIDVNCFYA
ncbi:hypothetical protein J2S92_004125 [Arthrobacter bambusae]|nr:hypothetical protein [Arthrobacter bambusae]MDQ0237718.1 hypothetical protein [Arthrobacter bambusae]